jgi:hypothetical protein
MRFRQFFIAHEDGFLAAFHYLGGATSALLIVAVIQKSTGYVLAAFACFAIAVVIWAHGRAIEQERIRELEEDRRTSGHSS